MDKLTLGVGLATDLQNGFNREGNGPWSLEKIKQLSEGDFLKGVLAVLEGRAEIRMLEKPPSVAHVPVSITFGLPLSPEKKVELLGGFERLDEDQLPNPRATGTVEWKPQTLELFLAPGQRGRGRMTGYEVRDALRESGKALFTIADLDLLKQKGLLPDVPVGTCLFAWGDILRDGGSLCVRYLVRGRGGWDWRCRYLDGDWFSCAPAAVRASS